MAYRDQVEKVIRENEEIRRALEKARADARLTAMRQVLLAFAFGLSWSILGDTASASTSSRTSSRDGDRCTPPPFGYGWVQIAPNDGSSWVVDDGPRGERATKLALRPGTHRVVFHGSFGEHCATVNVTDGRTAWAYDGERTCR